MSESWLEIQAGGVTSRVELKPGLTRLGGRGADVVFDAAPRGELHVWNDPPKLVYLGAADPPLFAGQPIEEHALRPGDAFEWAGATIRYGSALPAPDPGRPVLEEIPLEPPAAPTRAGAPTASAPPAAAPASGTLEGRAWDRVRAGMLVELGLADRPAAKRWQEAVLRGEYEPDACARDLLAASAVGHDDPRLLDRAGRLLRDFLMMPLQRGARGASRRMRGAARSGTAFVVAQLVVILIYTSLLLALMVLARLKWGWSFDAAFDRILGR